MHAIMHQEQPSLCLIVGLGLRAGIYYYERLVETCERAGHSPRLVMVHANVREVVPLVQSGDTEGLASYLSGLIERGAGEGVDYAAISAATPHVCIEALKRRSPLPILSLLDATAAELQKSPRRIAIFGTRFVIESDFYGALRGVDVVRPTPQEISEIQEIYFALALNGHVPPADRARLNRIGRELCERERLDAILLGGTDLSEFFAIEPPAFPSIDCSDIHVKTLAEVLCDRKNCRPG